MTALADPLPILVVEDQALIQDLIEAALEEGGYRVVLAVSGTDAAQALEDERQAFAAIVTDIDLGSGPSGWEVARIARRVRPKLPVIYMSGGSADGWSAEGVPDSVMVAKPFAPAQLVITVATQITAATTAAGGAAEDRQRDGDGGGRNV